MKLIFEEYSVGKITFEKVQNDYYTILNDGEEVGYIQSSNYYSGGSNRRWNIRIYCFSPMTYDDISFGSISKAKIVAKDLFNIAVNEMNPKGIGDD